MDAQSSRQTTVGKNVAHCDFIDRLRFRNHARLTLRENKARLSALEFRAIELRLGLDDDAAGADHGIAAAQQDEAPRDDESQQRTSAEVAEILNASPPAAKRPKLTADGEVQKPAKMTPKAVEQLVRVGLQKIPIAADTDAGDMAAFRESVLFENEELLIVNKLSGKRVTPFHRLAVGSVLNSAVAYLGGKVSETPAVLHRLDNHTSGVLVLGKTTGAARKYSDQDFWANRTKKVYLAILEKRLNKEGAKDLHRDLELHKTIELEATLDGKFARTDIRLVAANEAKSHFLAMCELVRSGRRHQIRRHCSECLGLALYGDLEYDSFGDFQSVSGSSASAQPGAFFLHARRLEMESISEEPVGAEASTSKEPSDSGVQQEQKSTVFEAPIPPAFLDCLRQLGVQVDAHALSGTVS